MEERRKDLSEDLQDYIRNIRTLIEELEAVDYYSQRKEATDSEVIKNILQHHIEEEIEHAVMNLEWLRRNDECWDEMLREFIFTEDPITEYDL